MYNDIQGGESSARQGVTLMVHLDATGNADVRGYVPRALSPIEGQLERATHPTDIADLVDSWVRTLAIGTDVSDERIDAIIESAQAEATECQKRHDSPFALVDQVRSHLIEKGLVIEEGLAP